MGVDTGPDSIVCNNGRHPRRRDQRVIGLADHTTPTYFSTRVTRAKLTHVAGPMAS